jgi:hypothetical protein
MPRSDTKWLCCAAGCIVYTENLIRRRFRFLQANSLLQPDPDLSVSIVAYLTVIERRSAALLGRRSPACGAILLGRQSKTV